MPQKLRRSTPLITLLCFGLPACSGGSSGPTAGDVPTSERGARLFAQNCVPCHREDAKGIAGVYPSLAQSPVVNGDPRELIRWVLGGERPASMPAGRYSTQMLKFGALTDADAAELLSYVRSHFGNASPPIDAAAVAAARP